MILNLQNLFLKTDISGNIPEISSAFCLNRLDWFCQTGGKKIIQGYQNPGLKLRSGYIFLLINKCDVIILGNRISHCIIFI